MQYKLIRDAGSKIKTFKKRKPEKFEDIKKGKRDELLKQTSELLSRAKNLLELGRRPGEAPSKYRDVGLSGKVVPEGPSTGGVEESEELIREELLTIGSEIDSLSTELSRMEGLKDREAKREMAAKMHDSLMDLVKKMQGLTREGLNRLEHKEMTIQYQKVRALAERLVVE